MDESNRPLKMQGYAHGYRGCAAGVGLMLARGLLLKHGAVSLKGRSRSVHSRREVRNVRLRVASLVLMACLAVLPAAAQIVYSNGLPTARPMAGR